jgi:hypothetical protein
LAFFLFLYWISSKNEIKQAQAEFKNSNLNGALSTLVKSEYLIINATYDDKSEF